MCELDGTGAVTAVNTFGADGLLSRHTASGSAFYAFDLSGNVVQRAASDGTPLSSDMYDAFGQRQTTASTADVFGFSGQWGGYTDAETGLVLMTHRYYDPSAGRFLTRDPAGYGGGINLYAYTQNDPVNRADPTGLDWDQGYEPFPIKGPPEGWGGIYVPGTNPINGSPISRVFGPGGARPGPEPTAPIGPEPMPMPEPILPPTGLRPPPFSLPTPAQFNPGNYMMGLCKGIMDAYGQLMGGHPTLPTEPVRGEPIEENPPPPPGIIRTISPGSGGRGLAGSGGGYGGFTPGGDVGIIPAGGGPPEE